MGELLVDKKAGGLSIRNMKKQNWSLMMKWLWKFATDEGMLWKEAIVANMAWKIIGTLRMSQHPMCVHSGELLGISGQ
uniref:Putative ovule protein n=1 Tax=Solanum chacoense TaxID=4108 RepID=A0A0V0HUE9_SOLCH